MCTPSILHICNLKIFEDNFEKTTGIENLEGEGKGKGVKEGEMEREISLIQFYSQKQNSVQQKAPGQPE